MTSTRAYIAETLEQWADDVRAILEYIEQERARHQVGQHGASEEERAFYQARLYELDERVQSFKREVS